jgi:Domain of unknown function (DUF4287)
MTFQAYLDNIRDRTGKTPADFHELAKRAGLVTDELTASQLVAWLKSEFDLGHGHSMAVWAVFKSKGWVSGTAKVPAAKRTGAKAR